MSNDAAFTTLLAHIKDERGFDFTGYKPASLQRRVRRRMDAVDVKSYEDYLDHLLVHPDEFTTLFNTVLINVTDFFRDPEAWAYLREQIVPDLLARREGQLIRVWSAGCASGQEAYSLAMLFAEALGIEEYRQRVKIYATDVDEEALVQARQAAYSARDLEGVPEELRATYFEEVANRFVFRKELRRSVIFGRNDLVQDAPISHVDVLSCRNTLMYFNAETQAQILGRLHFALRPDGVLFLGKAEMLLSHGSYFQAIELKRRFFRKIPPQDNDRRMPGGVRRTQTEEDLGMSKLYKSALMSSAAAQIAVDTDGKLAMCNNRAMHLFGLSTRDLGRPIQDLEVSYRPVELRSHIAEALRDRRQLWLRDVEWTRGNQEPVSLDVQVLPLADETGAELGATVIFNDVTQYRQLQGELQYANRQLETAYEELQSTNEELETTNEELQSTVEELETTNEELQSTNEELETMNEELQSMNDELQFSNESLRSHQEEVDRLNRFMSSVLGSMNSGVAVIDRDLTILAWNSKAEDLWGVRSDEAVGQHLLNLDIGLPLDDLRGPIRQQFGETPQELQEFEVDAINRRGRTLRVRLTLTLITDHGPTAPAVMLAMDATEVDS